MRFFSFSKPFLVIHPLITISHKFALLFLVLKSVVTFIHEGRSLSKIIFCRYMEHCAQASSYYQHEGRIFGGFMLVAKARYGYQQTIILILFQNMSDF